jgi:hypothetical protein
VGRSSFGSRFGQEIFLSCTEFRLALGAGTQSPIPRLSGSLFQWVVVVVVVAAEVVVVVVVVVCYC